MQKKRTSGKQHQAKKGEKKKRGSIKNLRLPPGYRKGGKIEKQEFPDQQKRKKRNEGCTTAGGWSVERVNRRRQLTTAIKMESIFKRKTSERCVPESLNGKKKMGGGPSLECGTKAWGGGGRGGKVCGRAEPRKLEMPGPR